MPILPQNTDPNYSLPDLEGYKVNLKNRHILQLKDNFNEKEVAHLTSYLAERLFTAQFATFYDYQITSKNLTMEQGVKLEENYKNNLPSLEGRTEDFYRFSLTVKKKESILHRDYNNGPESLDINWVFYLSFIDVHADLRKVAVINTEDLTIDNAVGTVKNMNGYNNGSFYGRSLCATFFQQYIQDYPEYVNRNFVIYKADDPANKDIVEGYIAKFRDNLLNTRKDAMKWLTERTCLVQKKDFSKLLDKKWGLSKE